MHKLINFACDELEELERKADKGGLSKAEIEYADTLAHLKKNLLKAEEMSEGEYSNGYSRDYSYARRRDSRGRYSSRYSMDDGMIAELHELMKKAPDDRTRMEFQKFIDRVESM